MILTENSISRQSKTALDSGDVWKSNFSSSIGLPLRLSGLCVRKEYILTQSPLRYAKEGKAETLLSRLVKTRPTIFIDRVIASVSFSPHQPPFWSVNLNAMLNLSTK